MFVGHVNTVDNDHNRIPSRGAVGCSYNMEYFATVKDGIQLGPTRVKHAASLAWNYLRLKTTKWVAS